jgi:hypothetical protein
MASNKKRDGLDQPSRNSVNEVWDKIDTLIGEIDKTKQLDEFSIAEYMDRIELQGSFISLSQAHKQLSDKVKRGVLTCRKAKVGGFRINVFKFV